MIKRAFIYLLGFGTLLASCEYNNNEPDAAPQPVIIKAEYVNYSPKEEAVIQPDEAVYIFADVKSEQTMHGYDVYLKNLTTGDTLFSISEHVHGNTMLIEDEWINDLKVETEVELEYNIRFSHDTDYETKKINFKCLSN